jgi:hypothetical protein
MPTKKPTINFFKGVIHNLTNYYKSDDFVAFDPHSFAYNPYKSLKEFNTNRDKYPHLTHILHKSEFIDLLNTEILNAEKEKGKKFRVDYTANTNIDISASTIVIAKNPEDATNSFLNSPMSDRVPEIRKVFQYTLSESQINQCKVDKVVPF